MDIIISGALPPRQAAKALILHLESRPGLMQLFRRRHAHIEHLDLAQLGCTPSEYLQLKARQYQPARDQRYVRGVSALASGAPAGSCWRCDLAHAEIDPQHSALHIGPDLKITKPESLALFEHIAPLLNERQIKILDIRSDYALISMPEELAPDLDSTRLMTYRSLHEHWPRSRSTRNFRLLFNEAQMLWHEHGVNQKRRQQGLKPVNALWICGGAGCDAVSAETSLLEVIDHLEPSYCAEDWGGWLSRLDGLEAKLFKLAPAHPQSSIILCGRDRFVRLNQPTMLQKITQTFNTQDKWHTWWIPS